MSEDVSELSCADQTFAGLVEYLETFDEFLYGGRGEAGSVGSGRVGASRNWEEQVGERKRNADESPRTTIDKSREDTSLTFRPGGPPAVRPVEDLEELVVIDCHRHRQEPAPRAMTKANKRESSAFPCSAESPRLCCNHTEAKIRTEAEAWK